MFGLPGIGRFFVAGAFNRDYTLVMGVTLLYGVMIVVANLIADLCVRAARPASATAMNWREAASRFHWCCSR